MKTCLFKNNLRTVITGVLLMSAFGVYAQPTCIVGGTNFDTEWDLCSPPFTDNDDPNTGSLPAGTITANNLTTQMNNKITAVVNSYCPDNSNHSARISSAKHLPGTLLGNIMSTNDGHYPFDAATKAPAGWGNQNHPQIPAGNFAGTTAIVANPRTLHTYLLNRPDNNMLVNSLSTERVPFFTYTVMGLRPGSSVIFEADFYHLVSKWAIEHYARSGRYSSGDITQNLKVFGGDLYSLSASGVTSPTPNPNATVTYTGRPVQIRIGTTLIAETVHPRRQIIGNGTNSAALPAGSATPTRLSFNGTADANGNITFYVARVGGGGVGDNYMTPIGMDSVVIKGDVQPQIASQKITPVCQANPVKLYPRQNYPAGTTFEWNVNTEPAESSDSETFTFIPFNKPSYDVSLAVQIPGAGCAKGTTTFNLETKECCTAVIDGELVPLAETYIFFDDFGTFPTNNLYQWKNPDGTVNEVPVAGRWLWGPYNPLPVGQKPADLRCPGLPKGYWSTAHADPHHNVCAILPHSPYGGQLTDASGTGRGGMLFFGLQGNGFQNAILYEKEVCGLCKGKEITFGAKFAAANSVPSSGPSPRIVGILDLVLREGRGSTGRQLYSTGNVTLEGGAGWKIAEHSFTIDTDETCVTLQVISRASDNGDGKGDFVIDDIFFSVCTPPEVLIDATVANGADPLNLCDDTDMTLKVDAADAVKKFYKDVRYLFQYTYDDVTWHDLGGIREEDFYLLANPPAHPVFSSLKNGDKVFFRVIVGDADYLTNNRPEWQSMSALSPCRAISISTFKFETALNCVKCTQSLPITIESTAPAPVTNGIKTVNLCPEGSTTLSSNNITPTPAYTNYIITWHKDSRTSPAIANHTADPGTTARSLTVNYADAGKYYVKVVDKELPLSSSCIKWDSILIIANPTPTVVKPTDQIKCSGENSDLVTFSGSPNGVTFDWINNNTAIGLAGSGTNTNSINSFPIVNSGTATITITPKANGCTGATQSFTITVSTTPAAPGIDSYKSCPAVTASGTKTWESLVKEKESGSTLIWYTTESGSTTVTPTPFDTTTAQPLTTYWVSQKTGNCESPRTKVEMEISATFSPAITDSPFSVCATAGSKTWASFVQTQGTIIWYSDAAGMNSISTPADIEFSTPMAEQIFYLRVVTPDGCTSSIAPVSAIVRARPTATLSGTATICNGGSANLSVNFTGTPPFNFTYSDGTTQIPVANITNNPYTIPVNPATLTTYTPVALSDAQQCNAEASDLSGTAVITVNNIPTVGAINQVAALCSGDELNEPSKPDVNYNGSPAVSEYWKIGTQGGAFVDITFPYTVSNADNGKILRFFAENGCGENFSETTITVNALPTVNIINHNTANSPNVLTCATPSINLTATGGVTYVWDNNLGSNANATVTSEGTYKVTVTDANGCVNTASISFTEDKIDPVADITNNSETDMLTCTKPEISLTATGGVSYMWSGNLGDKADAIVRTAGIHTVTVTAENGCTDIARIEIKADGSMPVADIINNSQTNVLTCTDTEINLTATGGVTYSWDNGLGNNANATVKVAGDYTVTATADNGCIATATIKITENKTPPTVNINSNTTILTCTETRINLTATGGVSYSWSHGLGDNASVTVRAVGTYTVTAKGSNGCTNTASETISADASMPVANITTNTGTTVLTCAVPTIILTANSGNYTYLWDDNFGTNASISVSTAGTYKVTVTSNENGCTATDNITITVNKTFPTILVTNPAICEGDNATITASGNADSYTWNTGETGANITVAPTATSAYTVTGTISTTGCTNTATATVYVETPLILTLIKPASVNLGEEITLTVNAEGPEHGYYSWFVNNAQFMTTAENSITFRPEAGRQQFRVETATTDLGCFAASESSIVNVEEIVMNAINPYNPNGRNCCFMKSDGTNPGYRVEIYNRYMQKVFEGDDGWDGTYRGGIADPGTYFYRLYKKNGDIEKGTLEVIKF